ncbi:MAG: hypothetical protein GX638_18790 [Crenarchaeota archaeon]|nr:hypothetical protein [Thermoproteota archaeon]
MPARISITSNPKKLQRQVGELIEAKKRQLNIDLVNYVLASFDVVLQNTPADTGQLMSNWKFYITRGRNSFEPLPDYKARRNNRYDSSGRLAMKDIAAREQLAVIAAEMKAANIDFFKEGRSRITVGIRNAAPYMEVVDEGLFRAKAPLVNVTPGGYSIQAPQGIVNVSFREIKGNNLFNQFVGVRGVGQYD